MRKTKKKESYLSQRFNVTSRFSDSSSVGREMSLMSSIVPKLVRISTPILTSFSFSYLA